MAIRMKNLFMAGTMAALIVAHTACTRPDFSAQASTVDSLRIQLDSSHARFSAVDCDSLQRIHDTIVSHLEYVQANYEGAMKRDMARHMANYRSLRKLVPDASRRKAEVEKSIATTRGQLEKLSEALRGDYTHDAAGNKLTIEYVNQLLSTERAAAEALIKEMDLVTQRSVLMMDNFHELLPQVRFWVDSIPPKPDEPGFQ